MNVIYWNWNCTYTLQMIYSNMESNFNFSCKEHLPRDVNCFSYPFISHVIWSWKYESWWHLVVIQAPIYIVFAVVFACVLNVWEVFSPQDFHIIILLPVGQWVLLSPRQKIFSRVKTWQMFENLTFFPESRVIHTGSLKQCVWKKAIKKEHTSFVVFNFWDLKLVVIDSPLNSVSGNLIHILQRYTKKIIQTWKYRLNFIWNIFRSYRLQDYKVLQPIFFTESWPRIVWLKHDMSNFDSDPLTINPPCFLPQISQIVQKVIVFFPERVEEVKP